MRLDADQRSAVASRGAVVVSAGAGSGKTTVLTGRFLSLVAEGVDIASILTLTFTRKAAAEMHQRIYRALADRAADGANTRYRRAFERFDEARISTLDSFVGEIARAGSAAFGIPPTFTADERQLARLCEQAATDFLLAREDEPVLRRLAADRGAEALLGEGLTSLAVEEMSPVTPTDFEATIERQLERCRNWADRAARAIDGKLAFIRSEYSGAAAQAKAPKLVKNAVAVASEAPELSGLDSESLTEALDAISDLKMTGGRTTDEAVVTLKELIGEMREQTTLLRECLVLLDSREEMRRLYALLAEFQQDVIRRKRSAGFLSFGDVMELAIAVLERSEPLRGWYRSRISHVMIDEFQDNNERQKRLLELVAGGGEQGGRELFFVGDEKQSIYRFRGADVSVFKRLAGEIDVAGGRRIALRTNYRSAPGLIARFNAIFERIMPGGADYEAGFEPLLDRTNVPDSGGEENGDERESTEGRGRGGSGDAGAGRGGREPTPRAGLGESIGAPAVHERGPALTGSPEKPQLRCLVRDAGGGQANHDDTGDAGGGQANQDDTGAAGRAGDGQTADPARDSAPSAGNGQTAAPAGDAAPAPAAEPSSSPQNTILTDTETEAFFVVETIHNTVEAGTLLVGDGEGGSRPAGYSDIAILMRSGTHQVEYERLLRRYAIPYRSESIRSLFLEAPANDIYAMLQLCVYPDDRYAFATLLRSPLTGISDALLVAILSGDVSTFAPLPPEVARFAAGDDIERYELARERYAALRGRADRVSITSLLHTIWYDFGYRTLYLHDRANHGYLEYYDFLCALAAEYEGDGLAAFLDVVRPQLGHYERRQGQGRRSDDLEVLGRGASGVQIMSIHKSKGLEFPVVFVVGCGAEGRRGGDSSGIWHRHREWGITFNLKAAEGRRTGTGRTSANVFLTQAKEQEAAEERAELRRLLYVAMTRAENHCILSGVWKVPDAQSGSSRGRDRAAEPNSFYDLLSPLLDDGLAVELLADRTEEQRRAAGIRISRPAADEIAAYYEGAEVVEFPRDRAPVSPSELNARELAGRAAEGAGESAEASAAAGRHPAESEEAASSAAGPAAARGDDGAGEEVSAGPAAADLPDFDCEAILDRADAHAAFGSLAHWCAAEYVEGRLRADMPAGALMPRLPQRLVNELPDEELHAVIDEAARRACAAVDAVLGVIAGGEAVTGERPAAGDHPTGEAEAIGSRHRAAASRADTGAGGPGSTARAHAELPFAMLTGADGPQINGVIDFVLERGEELIVADFKTDRLLDPQRYRVQMDLYRKAAAGLFGREPRVLIVSMRDFAIHRM